MFSIQDESLWACLAGMAAYAKDLSTAEVAYAAIDEVRTWSALQQDCFSKHDIVCSLEGRQSEVHSTNQGDSSKGGAQCRNGVVVWSVSGCGRNPSLGVAHLPRHHAQHPPLQLGQVSRELAQITPPTLMQIIHRSVTFLVSFKLVTS